MATFVPSSASASIVAQRFALPGRGGSPFVGLVLDYLLGRARIKGNDYRTKIAPLAPGL